MLSFLGVLSGLIVGAGQARAYTIATTSGGAPIRWAVQEIDVRLDAAYLAMLDDGQAYAALAMAFDAWRGLPDVPDLSVVEGEPVAPGHHKGSESNGVYLLSDWPYEAEKLAVTVVTFDRASGRLLDADILVNGEVAFGLLDEHGDTPSDTFDLAAILTHEAGHMLGLGESEDDPEATMWPYARPGDTHQRTLAEDDEEAAMEAYSGAAPSLSNGCGQASVLGAPHASDGSSWTLVLVVGLALAGRRRTLLLALLSAGLMTWVLAIDAALPTVLEESSTPGGELAPTHSEPGSGSLVSGAVGETSAIRAERVPPLAPHFVGAAGAEAGQLTFATGDVHPGLAVTPSDKPRRPSAQQRLSSILLRYPDVNVGTARRGEVDQSQNLWFTSYMVTTSRGERVEVRLPGGTDGELVQRVGDLELPEDGRELMVARDGRGRAVWTYHEEGMAFGGALGDDAAPLPN